MLELVDQFGWHKLSADEAPTIKERLKGFESMTWNQILVDANKHNHYVERKKLCKDAQARLKFLKLDDVEEFVSLKVDSLGRIWGIRENAVMLLLWWDPKHRICPSHKKHT